MQGINIGDSIYGKGHKLVLEEKYEYTYKFRKENKRILRLTEYRVKELLNNQDAERLKYQQLSKKREDNRRRKMKVYSAENLANRLTELAESIRKNEITYLEIECCAYSDSEYSAEIKYEEITSGEENIDMWSDLIESQDA